MKNTKKGSLGIILLIVIALAVGGGITYVATHNKADVVVETGDDNTPSVTPTPTRAPTPTPVSTGTPQATPTANAGKAPLLTYVSSLTSMADAGNGHITSNGTVYVVGQNFGQCDQVKCEVAVYVNGSLGVLGKPVVSDSTSLRFIAPALASNVSVDMYVMNTSTGLKSNTVKVTTALIGATPTPVQNAKVPIVTYISSLQSMAVSGNGHIDSNGTVHVLGENFGYCDQTRCEVVVYVDGKQGVMGRPVVSDSTSLRFTSPALAANTSYDMYVLNTATGQRSANVRVTTALINQ